MFYEVLTQGYFIFRTKLFQNIHCEQVEVLIVFYKSVGIQTLQVCRNNLDLLIDRRHNSRLLKSFTDYMKTILYISYRACINKQEYDVVAFNEEDKTNK
jgi:hypothetical protein